MPSNERTLRVGFIGLGDQGAPMARAIGQDGWPLNVWARSARSLDALAGVPHTVCASVEELARTSDVVQLVLTDDADVSEILDDRGLLAALGEGGVVVNHGTGDPVRAEELAALGEAAGHHVLDAPVSGGRPAAERRALTTFVGGDGEAAERCRPVFESFSTTVAWMGGPGTGQITKLLNNASLLANLRNAEEIVELGASLGLDAPNLVRVLQTGSGTSFALEFLAGEISAEMSEHLPSLWHKDIGHFSDAVRARRVAPTDLEVRAHQSVDAFARARALVA